jgi:hypothetical protein
MKRFIVLFLIFFGRITYAQPQAFVINNLAETLSSIDLETGQVQNHIVILGDTPNEIAYFNGFLYVVNSISANIQKIDPESHQIVADIPLPVASNPYSIAFNAENIFVSGLVSGKIYRINNVTNQITGELQIGGCPEGLLCHNGLLYVAQTGFNPSDFSYGQGELAIINLADFSLENEVNTGKNPQSIALAPDSSLHIVCTGNYSDILGAIYILNISSGAISDSLLIGGQPVKMVVSRNSIAYLAAGGWVSHGLIYSYNIHTKQILRGPTNPIISGLGVSDLALDSLGFLYSCNFGDDDVTKLNSSGEALRVFGVGDGPQSIVIIDDRIDEAADPVVTLPRTDGLLYNYPNPFNGSTNLGYCISSTSGNCEIAIYDISGRLVRNLPIGEGRRSGTMTWDGRDNNGQECGSGMYLSCLNLTAQGEKTVNIGNTIKLILVR